MLLGAERSSELPRSSMTRAELRGVGRNWREGRSLSRGKRQAGTPATTLAAQHTDCQSSRPTVC